MAPSLGSGVSISGLLVFGTITSLLAKIVYELQGEGLNGEKKYFLKPWAMVTVMFIGMSFSLPLAYAEQYFEKGKQGLDIPLLEQESTKKESLKEVLMLAIPTVFDLVATILMNIGLVSVTASVYQMLRGAEMLFAAIFAVLFLQRKLNKYHYTGIIFCCVGITLVGVASILSGEGSTTRKVSTQKMLIGMGLIIISQSVQAAQITFEDYFMADLSIPPLKIVGYEGLWGSLAMICVVLPIVYVVPGVEGTGFHEDTLDTLHMIRTTPSLAIVLVIDMMALFLYNFAGMCVTGHLGAVFRTVLETMRTLFVWLVGLVLWSITWGRLGESWTRASFVQAAGFLVLVTGTLIYGRGDEVEVRELESQCVPAGAEALVETQADNDIQQLVPPRPTQRRTQPIAMSPGTSFYKSSMSLASFSPHSVTRSALSTSYTNSYTNSNNVLPPSGRGSYSINVNQT